MMCRPCSRNYVLKAEASELDYTYHDRWRASDHEGEREEDLEFSRQIDMKACPLFDQEDERIERLLWGEQRACNRSLAGAKL